MRVLVVSNLYPPVVRGGYEVECAGVVEHLRERHDVSVLTSSLERGSAPPESSVQRELPFVEYRKPDSFRAPLDALRAARTTERALAQLRPELVYVWNGSQIPQAALAALARSGVPLAFRVGEHWFGRLWRDDRFMRHLQPGERGARGAWAGALRLVNRHPTLRLDPGARFPCAISWVTEALRALSPPPDAAEPLLERVLFPVTRDQDRFRAVERCPTPEPELLFAGRLEPQKGPEVLVRALAVLREHHGNAPRALFAGPAEAEARRALLALASELGVADRLELLGPLAPDALAERMAAAHVLVIPPVWQEPAGLTCFEGALAGVPIVASRIGGIPELLEDERHALLFEPGDAAACADAIARALVDGGERAARARQHVERFTYARYLAEQERFVADACAALSAAAR